MEAGAAAATRVTSTATPPVENVLLAGYPAANSTGASSCAWEVAHSTIGTKRMTLDRFAKPALLIVDMQNDFVRVGAPMEVPQARDTIAQHLRLIEHFRKSRLPIAYTRFL